MNDIAISDHEGIAENHPQWHGLRNALEARFKYLDRKVYSERLRDLEETDFLLVYVENDVVVDVCPFAIQDIEEIHGPDDKKNDRSQLRSAGHVWTSFLEVLPESYLDDVKQVYEEPD